MNKELRFNIAIRGPHGVIYYVAGIRENSKGKPEKVRSTPSRSEAVKVSKFRAVDIATGLIRARTHAVPVREDWPTEKIPDIMSQSAGVVAQVRRAYRVQQEKRRAEMWANLDPEMREILTMLDTALAAMKAGKPIPQWVIDTVTPDRFKK